MALPLTRYLRYIRFPALCCVLGLTIVTVSSGWLAGWVTLVLLALEISLSFDNAVVNARVLERLTPAQQSFFLTWGLVIPVFGVRFLGPLMLVSLSSGVSITKAFEAAINDPEAYHALLMGAEPKILAFGGTFLLMVFLRYFIDDAKTIHWVNRIETRLSQIGKVDSSAVALALIVLLVVAGLLPAEHRGEVMIAGGIGLVLQIICTSLADVFGGEGDTVGRLAAQGGLASLIYLELLDASFSLDGTIGAFAITNKLPLILTGLGLGALFIRSLTVMLTREKALEHLIYLEHGAHYAIGALGGLMLLGVGLSVQHHHVPEWLSGVIGVVLLTLSLWDSLRHNRISRGPASGS